MRSKNVRLLKQIKGNPIKLVIFFFKVRNFSEGQLLLFIAPDVQTLATPLMATAQNYFDFRFDIRFLRYLNIKYDIGSIRVAQSV